MNNGLTALLTAFTIAAAPLAPPVAPPPPPASIAAGVRVANAPALFVHGYLLNLCPQGDASKTFASASTVLKNNGHTGKSDFIDYYACDSGGSNIQTHGNPSAYFPSGANSGLLGGMAGGNTNDTDIRHISYQLAWYIYDTYSSKGQTVEVVSHSMGGLITNWMLYQVQVKNPVFPPYLYVQDSVTISTPFNGVNDGYNNISWCPSGIQCQQMLPNSTFLTELRAQGLNAQATTAGTDHTAIGGSPCDSVDKPIGTTLAGGDIHKVWYYANTPQAPTCYDHVSYLNDTSTAVNMPIQSRNPGDSIFTTGIGPHSLTAVAQAVMSSSK
ncbi:MAG: hypothetical protein JWM00_741 [Candidatus Saccharibacteria bacterium]|nr:hypothetical protein [Candidatus Saccharibacteria bacterium]